MVKFTRNIFNLKITIKFQPKTCPFTKQKRHLCTNPCCDVCFNKSFASDPRVRYWSKLNTLSPRDVYRRSRHKIYFKCERCKNDFQRALGNLCKHCICHECRKKM